VLEKFRDHLISKNVASEIAEKLCESVASQLIGKQLGSFTRVSTTVKSAMEEALTRILTPKRRIDILREVQAVRASCLTPRADLVLTRVIYSGSTRKATLFDCIRWCQRCRQVNFAVKSLFVAVEQQSQSRHCCLRHIQIRCHRTVASARHELGR